MNSQALMGRASLSLLEGRVKGQAEQSSDRRQAPGLVPSASLPEPLDFICNENSTEVVQELQLGIEHQFPCLRNGYQPSRFPA